MPPVVELAHVRDHLRDVVSSDVWNVVILHAFEMQFPPYIDSHVTINESLNQRRQEGGNNTGVLIGLERDGGISARDRSDRDGGLSHAFYIGYFAFNFRGRYAACVAVSRVTWALTEKRTLFDTVSVMVKVSYG